MSEIAHLPRGLLTVEQWDALEIGPTPSVRDPDIAVVPVSKFDRMQFTLSALLGR